MGYIKSRSAHFFKLGLKLIQEFSTELRVGIKVVSKMFQTDCQDREKCSAVSERTKMSEKFQSYISQNKITVFEVKERLNRWIILCHPLKILHK